MILEEYRSIEDLLSKRDVKRAEILIARQLRAGLTAPERAKYLIARAHARLLSARPDDALDDLNTARELCPADFDAPYPLELTGDCYFARFELASVGFADRADTAHALAAYDQLLEQFPHYNNRGWIQYQRGRVLLSERQIDEAITCFEQALSLPNTIPTLTAFCYERLAFVAFYEQRTPEQALDCLSQAAATYPAGEDRAWLVHVYTLRSRVLRDMQDYPAAVDAANAAIHAAEDKDALGEALLNAAETLSLIEGREREVIADLQQYIQVSKKPLGIDVTWSRVHEMLGDALYQSGQLLPAVTAYQAALEFNPYTPWEVSLHYRIARTLYQLGDYEKSVQAIQTMLQAAETDGQVVGDYRVYNILGNACFALNNYDDAISAYQTALEFAPASAENLDKIKQYYQFARELSHPV